MIGPTPYRADGPLARGLRARVQLPVPELVFLLPAFVAALAAVTVASVRGHGDAVASSLALVSWLLALAGSTGVPQGRLTWPVPGFLRAVEYLVILALTAPGPWQFTLLGALAFHHYDIVYRSRGGGPEPSRWVATATGGWELRTLVLLIAVVVGALSSATVLIAVLVTPIVTAESVASWWRHTR